MKEGLIIKLTGGLYTVKDKENICYDIYARGKFRHQNRSPKVGDYAIFDESYILDIKERKNDLVRPPICNVDQAIIITSCKDPNFSLNLLDRFLALIEYNDILPIIIINKIDLLKEDELEDIKKIMRYYQMYYDVYFVSSKTQEGVELIKGIFKDKVSVLSGQTGAGKSSLINALDQSFSLKTGEISKALGRGRHTTRHTELHELLDGLVADTPGFSKLEFEIEETTLKDCFVDFFAHSSQCKFRGCMHVNEPKCKVKEMVLSGEIIESRYRNYLQILEEIKNRKPRYGGS